MVDYLFCAHCGQRIRLLGPVEYTRLLEHVRAEHPEAYKQLKKESKVIDVRD
jgi:hypothetical protein